jgi:hypothetical protein
MDQLRYGLVWPKNILNKKIIAFKDSIKIAILIKAVRVFWLTDEH